MRVTKKLHPRDTMTSEQRLQAVVKLQKPDRVPVGPLFYNFNAFYNKMPNPDLLNAKKYYKGLSKIFDDLGPWDINYHGNPYYRELLTLFFPMKSLEPGIDLPEDSIRQFLEEEIMKEKDYDWLIRLGNQTPKLSFIPFIVELISRIWDQVPGGLGAYAYLMPRLAWNLVLWLLEYKHWADKGVATFYPIGAESAFDTFSMSRGIMNFIRDLRSRPEQIVKASDALTDSFVFIGRLVCTLTGINRFLLCLHRSSNDFISPKQFSELSLPCIKDLTEKLAAHGISTVLHCDGNWEQNLELMRTLPAASCFFQGDSATDLRKVKEVLGDRMCIYGDVPAGLLAMGSPSEVDEYCHALIEDIGKGGGFILGSGCELAPNSKPENVKVMMESVVKYGYYSDSVQREEVPLSVAVPS